MKKFLFLVFLFIAFCLPSFATETIFVQNITSSEVKKALINYMFSKHNLQIKNEGEYSINFVETRSFLTNDNFAINNIQFTLIEQNNGIRLNYSANTLWNPNTPKTYSAITTDPMLYGEKKIRSNIKELFLGNYDYNVKYNIKKDYVLISDTNKTMCENYVKLGQKRRIIKIDDKNISEYRKADLKALFANCSKDKIKLEINDNLGYYTVYLLRTYTEPTYKQYL